MRRIFVAGHRGMVGQAVCLQLASYSDITVITRSRDEIDLMDQKAIRKFFAAENLDEIIMCGAKVGGIQANNNYPAEFIYENLQIQNNLIHEAHKADIQKLLFLGSSCIYPVSAPQPIQEQYLLNGYLEPTNEPYAIAKIAGIKMCESYNRQYGRDYRSIMPTNLYGPKDNFYEDDSHVIPALIARFHNAKIKSEPKVIIWGSGTPKREFLYVDDMAKAACFVLNLKIEEYKTATSEMLSHLNIGSGSEVSIRELAYTIKDIIGYLGEVEFDASKPNGSQRKLLDVTKINNLGWRASVNLNSGLVKTYDWYVKNIDTGLIRK
jgi:GDP-L-fucose synthase